VGDTHDQVASLGLFAMAARVVRGVSLFILPPRRHLIRHLGSSLALDPPCLARLGSPGFRHGTRSLDPRQKWDKEAAVLWS
jgi:hypothetical protein